MFTSHDKAEQAKDKVQSFVAHDFWLDEMPSHASYMEEAQRRVDAKRGQFRATFTPKSRNGRYQDTPLTMLTQALPVCTEWVNLTTPYTQVEKKKSGPR